MIRIILVSAVAAVLSVGAASAATLSFFATPTGPTFNNPTSAIFTGSYLENISTPGLNPGVSRSPWQDFANDGGIYSAISNGAVTFTFQTLGSVFSLVWGSPDAYNSMEFYNGNTLVDTVFGAAIQAGSGAVTVNGNRQLSLISILTAADFDTVIFRSTGSLPAFEFAFADTVAQVPLPAGGLLLLGGLAGLTALRRRKSV